MVRSFFVFCIVLVGTVLYSSALPPGVVAPATLSVQAAVISGPDNRYCSAPRTPKFGATTMDQPLCPSACINRLSLQLLRPEPPTRFAPVAATFKSSKTH